MNLSTKPYLQSFRDTIVDDARMLMIADRGSIYNLKTHEMVLNLQYTPDICAVKNEILVCIYKRRIYIHKIDTKACFKHKLEIDADPSAIYFGAYLAIGCYDGKLYIFDKKFKLEKLVQVGRKQIPSIIFCSIGLIAISVSGELIVYSNGNILKKRVNTALTALTVKNVSDDIEILLGDCDGFLYFVKKDLSDIHRKRISEDEIAFLFFHKNLYYIADGFVWKINNAGVNKIYGTVCSDPCKIFKFENKIFCTSHITGVSPIIDRKEDLYDKVMKF